MARMSRQLRHPIQDDIKKYIVLLSLLCIPLSVMAENSSFSQRGDELLTFVQSDALEAQVIALQENVVPIPNFHAHRTRNAHHREATENIVRYIKSQFHRSPRLRVSEQVFGGIKNIVAVLPARANSSSKRIFIICAHYDTAAGREPNWNPLATTAPGANNNGTGVAAMLEIAYFLSRYEYDHELRFVALGGEELGFLGSRFYVRNASAVAANNNTDDTVQTRERIVCVFNLDMFGFNWKSDLVEVVGNNDSSWISRALIIANRWYDIGLKIRRTQDEFVDISSHKSFWDSGYNAVTLTESSTPWRDSQNYDANTFYHTSADTADKVNFRLVRKVTQLVLVTIDSLLTDMFDPIRQIPQVTLELPPTTKADELEITGTFRSDFPIDVIVYPSQVEAVLDRETQTWTAMVPLKPGKNDLRVIARYPLGAVSVAQSTFLTQVFAWKEVVVFPNPVRSDTLTEFRVEANADMTEMRVFIYDSDGNLIKRIEGVADRLNQKLWRTWWNQQTSYGLAVSPGVYVCHISVVSKGETYTYLEKLAILR
ncbi:Zn-dependent exopeptidase M28 [Candidatus Poribacteria bacterium]|nr:Zn-dependent exopeptidase M28 [Candidatus Poribacteria bacterium]MYA99181.1 Zn-dependent exopeptidase M28 [Candidatus Poribacteria bacterium]